MSESAQHLVPGTHEHPSIALVNTLEGGAAGRSRDALSTPEGATAWLVDRGMIAPEAELYEPCRRRLVELREDLRDLFIAHVTGGIPSPESIDAVNRALTSAPGALLLRFDPRERFSRGVDHPATQVVEHVMAVIAEDAAALLAGEDAPSLAACEAPSCRWFFLRTHARRQWCSTRCGDRVRAARAYARKRAQQVAQTR
ncbi:CGNR zinc finger domain-containing protein [Nesterenkonia sp. PF2B19]|uniref:CGNR zinc finger domain-containing protein n=1 Tax=Nesterenkonia sp. PF2B19 TaxID=1881858 RepID=UPI000872F5C3|nr:CGNR zinc finger domain-containing protein [Nesterenkonia sp. PF2B19]